MPKNAADVLFDLFSLDDQQEALVPANARANRPASAPDPALMAFPGPRSPPKRRKAPDSSAFRELHNQ